MEVEDIKLFRLASVLYRDDNFNTSRTNIIKKIIESIYIKENKYYSVEELIGVIKQDYSLEFIDNEIYEALDLNMKHFIKKEDRHNNIIYRLSESRYEYLIAIQSMSIIDYINNFIEENDYDNNYKETIIRFLYLTFTSNLNNYNLLLHPKEEKVELQDLDIPDEFNLEEKKIINEFLLEDDIGKNKEIYKIVNLSLEYCILTGDRDFSGMNLLKGKNFYLDSNIIYRGLGLNGENRKDSINNFLNKCLSYNINLKILYTTDQEFKKTLDYNIKKLEKRTVSNVNPALAIRYTEDNIAKAYYLWMNNREDKRIDKFKSWILASYQTLLKEYEIEIEKEIIIDSGSDTYSDLLSSISKYKDFEALDILENDAKMIYSFNNIRFESKDFNNSFKGTKNYIITTDQKLINWNNNTNPTKNINLPSHWLGIILRYGTRVVNSDYDSFSTFLTLPLNSFSHDPDTTSIVLSVISETIEDVSIQKAYAYQLIEEDVLSLKNEKDKDNDNDEDSSLLKERIFDYIESSSEDKIIELTNRLEDKTEESLIKTKEIEESNKRISKIEGLLLENEVEKKVDGLMIDWKKNYRKEILILSGIGIGVLISIAFHFKLKDWKYNHIYRLLSHIEEGDHNTFMSISVVLHTGLLGFVGQAIVKRLYNRNSNIKNQRITFKEKIEREYK